MHASSLAAKRFGAVCTRPDRKLAERNLAKKKDDQSLIDRSQGKVTLAGLCDRYLKTVQHQKPKTVERKTFIVRRIKSDWPTGKLIQVGKVKPSENARI